MRRTLIGGLAVIALATTASGCGGSDSSSQTSPTAEWASSFCTAVTDWKNTLQSVKSDVTSNPSQDGLESAAEDVRGATDTLVSDLKGLGAPDTESGQEVKDSLDSLSETLDTESASIQKTADGVSGIADLPNAISEISTSLSTLGTAFSQTLQTIDDADAQGELKTAFEDSPECKDLSS